MTDRYYPLGYVPEIPGKWASTYELGNRMETKPKSKFPPGYSGHEHGARAKFGYSCPAPDNLPAGVEHIQEKEYQTIHGDVFHKQYRTQSLPMRDSFGMKVRQKTDAELKAAAERKLEAAKPAPEQTSFTYNNAAQPSQPTDPWTGIPTVIGEEHTERDHGDDHKFFICRYTSEDAHLKDATGKSKILKEDPYTIAHGGTGTGFKGNNLDTSVFIARPLMPSNSVSHGIKIKPDYTSSYDRDYNKPMSFNRRGLEFIRFSKHHKSMPSLLNVQ